MMAIEFDCQNVEGGGTEEQLQVVPVVAGDCRMSAGMILFAYC